MKHSLRAPDVTRYSSVFLKLRSTYVCAQCRQIAFASARAPTPLSYIQRRFASDDNAWTENLRRKLWGTTDPPGQKDPYTYESIDERDKKRGKPVKEPQEVKPDKASSESVATASSDKEGATGDYVPAKTWDGLDQIGGQDESWEQAWVEANPFAKFVYLGSLTGEIR